MCLENGGGAGTHPSRTTNMMRPGWGPWRRVGEEEASFLRFQGFVVSWAFKDRAAWDLMGLEGISGGRNNERQA